MWNRHRSQKRRQIQKRRQSRRPFCDCEKLLDGDSHFQSTQRFATPIRMQSTGTAVCLAPPWCGPAFGKSIQQSFRSSFFFDVYFAHHSCALSRPSDTNRVPASSLATTFGRAQRCAQVPDVLRASMFARYRRKSAAVVLWPPNTAAGSAVLQFSALCASKHLTTAVCPCCAA